MATIRQLPSGKFNAQIRIKGTPSGSRSFGTYEEACSWAEAQAPISRTPASGVLTLGSLAIRYCSTQLKGKPSPHMMLEKMERVAKHFPQPFISITRAQVNEFRLKRLSEVSGPTVREDLQIINKLFRWAEREMIFGERDLPSPAKNIALPPPCKPRSRVVEEAELQRLLSALPDMMKVVVELAYETAMRRSEIVRLTPRVLHLNDRCLSVIDGKTGDRIVPLTSRAVVLLTSAKERCRSPDDRVFPIAPHSVSTAVRRARRAVGLDDGVRLHQLRHTRISLVARKGFNQAQIMMVSGHRDSRSVQRYTHLNVSDVIRLLD
jgi:integrase